MISVVVFLLMSALQLGQEVGWRGGEGGKTAVFVTSANAVWTLLLRDQLFRVHQHCANAAEVLLSGGCVFLVAEEVGLGSSVLAKAFWLYEALPFLGFESKHICEFLLEFSFEVRVEVRVVEEILSATTLGRVAGETALEKVQSDRLKRSQSHVQAHRLRYLRQLWLQGTLQPS